ncbi:MAG: tetratricopeptide repeat protein [Paracoccaceae bacterium]|nr:tetratricopeptide repeat protein [Paracoccaceae bacterium]
MLWSLIKILLFVAAIAALALGAGMLMETGGGVRIAVPGWEFTLGPFQIVVVTLGLLLILWLALKALGLVLAVFRFLNGDETAISRYFDRNRERRGFQTLAEGMLAVASGEGRLAMSKAARAERLLGRPELTTLLQAQAAEVAGDGAAAQAAYKKLLGDDRTRFVGVRGILKQKLAEGDTGTALKLAAKAFALKPRHEETQDILLKLQAGEGDWKGARGTLGAKLKSGALPRDVYRRRDALLALSEAKGVLDEEAPIEVREAAIEANRLSPDLIPAAAMAARSYIAQGKARHAARVLKRAWAAQPHPDLAAAFAEIAPDETPEERLKRFRALTGANPDHEETKLLLAELHIAAEDFPAARRALGDLASAHPNQRTLTVMAAIERGEGGDDAVVRGWLARALTASRGPQWVCDTCHNIQADWAPFCDNCEGFDTLSWREPAEREAPMPHGAQMLPLIVGAPKPEAEPELEPEAAAETEPQRPPEAEVIDAEELAPREK